MKISGMNYAGLNPACGPYYMDGWLNTEYQADMLSSEGDGKTYHADLYCDYFDLPNLVEEQSFDKIYFGHFLEHIHEHRIIESLQIGMSLLKNGGEFMIVGPDYNKAQRMGVDPGFLIQVGKHDYNGDPDHPYSHKWESTEERTIAYMEKAGLQNVHAVMPATTMRPHWPNRANHLWQLFVVGTVVH